jgi:hypothetical protein
VRTYGILRQLYEQWRGQPVTARGSVYITVFGNPTQESFTLADETVDVAYGLRCAMDELFRYYALPVSTGFVCRRPFRFSAHAISYFRDPFFVFGAGPTTYSPFPSSLDLNGVAWSELGVLFTIFREMNEAGALEDFDPDEFIYEGVEIDLTVREMLGHVRRDFEFTIDLEDYVAE